MKIVNLTPHAIVVRQTDGSDLTIPASGTVARVSSTPGAVIGTLAGAPVLAAPTWGDVTGLPDPMPGTAYVVSALVLARCAGRADVVAPATGPADGAVRGWDGRIVAVTRFVAA